MIRSLRQCDGVGDYRLMVAAEPGHANVVNLIKKIDFMEVDLTVNKRVLGLARNTGASTRRAFDICERVIVLEDDIVLSKDALKWFEWGLDKYADDKSIWSITASSKYHIKSEAKGKNLDPCGAFKQNFFSCWGWATWRDRYDEFWPIWPRGGSTWATPMKNYVVKKGYSQIGPYINRALQIGAQGVHMRPTLYPWFTEYAKGDNFMGSKMPNGPYKAP